MDRKSTYDKKLLLILDSACGIFAKKGFHNASVRDVAAATGVSPAGLYYYFRSKEELLRLILETSLSSLLDRIEDDVRGIEDPGTRLRVIIRSHLSHFEKNGKEMRVIVHEWGSVSRPFGEGIRSLMRRYSTVVRDTFRDLYPDKTPRQLRAATFGLFGMLTWVDQWYRPGRDLPLDLLSEEFAKIFLGGFLPAPRTTAAASVGADGDPEPGWSKASIPSVLAGPGF